VVRRALGFFMVAGDPAAQRLRRAHGLRHCPTTACTPTTTGRTPARRRSRASARRWPSTSRPRLPQRASTSSATATTRFYLNTNGNITFRAGCRPTRRSPFPVADQPMIAPWWGDVDTRGGGQPSTQQLHLLPHRAQPHRRDLAQRRLLPPTTTGSTTSSSSSRTPTPAPPAATSTWSFATTAASGPPATPRAAPAASAARPPRWASTRATA
jgi:hypothetical protein